MEQLIKEIIKWGESKGINNPDKQFVKLAEEMLEAHEACVAYNDFPYADYHLMAELGDIGVVWILLCNMLDISPQEALETAHDKNKDRKGKTINGTFIKEEDLHDN